MYACISIRRMSIRSIAYDTNYYFPEFSILFQIIEFIYRFSSAIIFKPVIFCKNSFGLCGVSCEFQAVCYTVSKHECVM